MQNVDNPNICTIAVNPKECFEKFENRSINKNHKGVRKDTKIMCFEAYAARITSLKYFDEKIEQKKWFEKGSRPKIPK